MAAQQPARTSPELRARLHSARANVGITPRPGALPTEANMRPGLINALLGGTAGTGVMTLGTLMRCR